MRQRRPRLQQRDQRDREFEEIVVKVKRCSKTVKGGKRFSFNATVVVGDRKGRVGWGYGKANEVPFAVNKAIQEGKKSLIRVPIVRTTIPHEITMKFGATRVLLRPACRGTGVKAGAAARAVLELAGVQDILTKVCGSTNPINVVKATCLCLASLRTKEEIEKSRGVRIVSLMKKEPKERKEPAEAQPAPVSE